MSYSGQRLALPPITPAIKQLMIVNAAVFGLNVLLLGRLSWAGDGGGGFWFAFSWPLLLEGYGLGALRLLTYQFTHSFQDAWHFVFNMLTLFFLGTLAETRLGYRGTWKMYVVGGMGGAVLFLVLAAMQGYAHVPLVGASGACYAMLVYAAAFAPNVLIFNCLPLWIVAAILVGVAIYQTFIEFATGFGGGVSHSAHLGGAAMGWFAFKQNWFCDHVPYEYQASPLARLRTFWAQKRAAARHRADAAVELQLDAILAKVKQSGLSSLSAAERRFLERASRDKRHDS